MAIISFREPRRISDAGDFPRMSQAVRIHGSIPHFFWQIMAAIHQRFFTQNDGLVEVNPQMPETIQVLEFLV